MYLSGRCYSIRKISVTGIKRQVGSLLDCTNQTLDVREFAGRGDYTSLTAERFAKEVTLEEGSIWLVYKHAEIAIRKWVSPNVSNRVLDWGCGAGKSSLWLKSLNIFREVEGADLNEEMIKLCVKPCSGLGLRSRE